MRLLPSLGDLDGAFPRRIFLWTDATDMRRAFDSLSMLVREKMNCDIFAGDLFVFRSRCSSRLKILFWDGDGFVLWYKRLEEGVFRFPKVQADQQTLSLKASELAMLLSGIDLRSVKHLRRYVRPGS